MSSLLEAKALTIIQTRMHMYLHTGELLEGLKLQDYMHSIYR